MPNEITIKAEGEVTIASFREIVDAFIDMVADLTTEAAKGDTAVEWIISKLEAGSARIVIKGVGGNAEGKATVGAVIDRYAHLAKSANTGRIAEYSEPIQNSVRRIASVMNGQVTDILMGVGEVADIAIDRSLGEENEVGAPDEPPPITLRKYARTAIKGQVVTLDQKHGVYVTLKQAYTGRLIRCYPSDEFKNKLAEFWTSGTWIIVEGTFGRYGGVQTLYAVTDIVELETVNRGGWRAVAGIAPRAPEGKDKHPSDAVRKVRDGEG